MNNGNPPPQVNRLIRLDEGTIVTPLEATDSSAFVPFNLPPLPLSQDAWLAALGALFHRKRRRCIALHLMIDCKDQRWVEPVIATQCCGSTSSTWSVHEKDLAHLPASTRVGGSFQTGIANDLDAIKARVPAYDGIHCYLKIDRRNLTKYWLVRIAGHVEVIAPEFVLIDDWMQCLTNNYDRFDFGDA